MDAGNIANSGMKAALTNMGTIGNNIANANTTGYKECSLQFSDVYALGASNTVEGVGVRVAQTTQDFSSGGVELTGRALDLNIVNSGFFILRNPANSEVTYTRAGRMDVDPNGYLLGVGYARAQGYPAINGTLITTGKLVDLQIPSTPLPAKPTQTINNIVNLDSSVTIPASTFNITDPTSYNYQAETLIYDSLGDSYAASLYYIKTAANSWQVNVNVNNVSAGTGTLSFNSNGTLVSSSGLNNLSFSPVSGAASPQTFSVNMSGSTEFGGFNEVHQLTQDGYTAGNQNGYHIDNSGQIMVNYTNGQSLVCGQIALANFTSLQGLSRVGNMSWVSTTESGAALLNQNNSLNNLQSGALELSNSDLTGSMVELMNAQYDFQANAHAEQIHSEVMKTITNL